MTTLAALLAVGCLAVAGFHLLRMVVVRADPVGEASHAAMGVGMAAMFSPLDDPVPTPVWTAVFLLCGGWFVAVGVRSPPGPRRSHAMHHVIGSGAMLFMLLGAQAGGVAGIGAVHAGHGHDVGPGGGIASVATIVLAGYFAWHVLRCADRLRACPHPVNGGPVLAPARVGDARAVAVAHVVMATAMTVMLVGMI